jgi:arabinosaccharide transport system substrate-binding protein
MSCIGVLPRACTRLVSPRFSSNNAAAGAHKHGPTMSFHLGKPILVMIVMALVTGFVILRERPRRQADMIVWTFVESHARTYRGEGKEARDAGEAPVARFQRLTGRSVRVVHISARAEDVRLLSMFNSPNELESMPDAAEIEIGAVGKYFRPPVDEVGFLPLNDYLKKSGWYDDIVQSRFAPWSKEGRIFGVPHDLHPTTITYRKDLFDEAGVDLAACQTWDQFHQQCLKFQSYWRQRGKVRAAAGFTAIATDVVMVMLGQRRCNLIDEKNAIHIADPVVADTIARYVPMVAGAHRIGAEFNPAPGQEWRDMIDGTVCCMITPDWRIDGMKDYGRGLSGKVAMMPLPRFDPTDARSASWGGTMIGIPRKARNPDLSWKLIETIYLDHDAIRFRRHYSEILPPIRKYWSDPIYHQPDPFFGGQKVAELYLELAAEQPPRYVTPFTLVAQGLLNDVLNDAVTHYNRNPDGADLRRFIDHKLDEAATDLARRIEFGTFED